MVKWICSKCKVEVEEVDDIKIIFKDIDLPAATGFRCPSCNIEYLDGDYVAEQLAAIEGMLEGK